MALYLEGGGTVRDQFKTFRDSVDVLFTAAQEARLLTADKITEARKGFDTTAIGTTRLTFVTSLQSALAGVALSPAISEKQAQAIEDRRSVIVAVFDALLSDAVCAHRIMEGDHSRMMRLIAGRPIGPVFTAVVRAIYEAVTDDAWDGSL